jgi:hypothetical protein
VWKIDQQFVGATLRRVADAASLPLTGGCPCGRVRFEISEPLIAALYCHCKRCQRRTGTAFSVSALTVPGSFRISEGEDSVRTWDPGDGGWTKSFCSECGGHLFTTSPDGEARSVRMGALDHDPGVRPAAHQFTDYAASWEPIPDDGLPRFERRRVD